MLLRLLALTLAAAAALLAYEFFKTLLVVGSTFNMHYVVAGTAGIVLSAVATWRMRRKRLADAQDRKSLENSI